MLDADIVQALSTRILAQEHRIHSEAILSGRYRIEGRAVVRA
jgi:folate-dependent phosphoribosylglycinamide formyltransferase PurN